MLLLEPIASVMCTMNPGFTPKLLPTGSKFIHIHIKQLLLTGSKFIHIHIKQLLLTGSKICLNTTHQGVHYTSLASTLSNLKENVVF